MDVFILGDALGLGSFVVGALTLAVGALLGAVLNLADRWQGRRIRRGDLAAVGVRHEHFRSGSMPVPAFQVGRGEWITSQPSIDFPMTVTNGSGEKITSVEFGIRWGDDGSETIAGFASVLLPDEREQSVAQEGYDEAAFEELDFEDVWLGRIQFFVRFSDQRGKRHENVLKHRPISSWTSTPI
jgi:hypothetical protein